MNLPETVNVALSPFQALALVRLQARAGSILSEGSGDALDAVEIVGKALAAWLASPAPPPLAEPARPKRKRGRPRKAAPDVFDAAKAEHDTDTPAGPEGAP